MDGELLAEYPAGTAPGSPQKEYGYRNGQLLVTAAAGGWGAPPPFTPPPTLVSGLEIKLEHLTELRSAVNQLRAHAGLSAFNFTVDPNPERYVTTAKADHIRQLRTALEQARSQLGLSTGGYEHPTLTENSSWIYAIDFQELRNQILSAWNGGSGSVDIQWLVADQLGTPRMIIGKNGTLTSVKRHDYLPFGEELVAGTGGRTTGQGYVGDNVRQKFTDKERDDESGLDYFINRYYSSLQGRFTTVDPENAGAGQSNPQSWNGYAYALNSPVKYQDPDGLTVRICGADGQCTDSKTDLTDADFYKYFRDAEGITLKGGNIYQNGNLIGSFQRLSFDDLNDFANGVIFGRGQTAGLVQRLEPVQKVVTIGAAIDVGIIGGVTIGLSTAGSTAAESAVSQASRATVRAFERQFAQHGRVALEKSLMSFEKRLAEHLLKIEAARRAGGYTSSMEREIKIFQESISAIKEILGKK